MDKYEGNPLTPGGLVQSPPGILIHPLEYKYVNKKMADNYANVFVNDKNCIN